MSTIKSNAKGKAKEITVTVKFSRMLAEQNSTLEEKKGN